MDKMNDLISVIVPIYNTEEYLTRCIDSIRNQSYSNLEIILVDDGSPDQCPQMCDTWAAEDPRICAITAAMKLGRRSADQGNPQAEWWPGPGEK